MDEMDENKVLEMLSAMTAEDLEMLSAMTVEERSRCAFPGFWNNDETDILVSEMAQAVIALTTTKRNIKRLLRLTMAWCLDCGKMLLNTCTKSGLAIRNWCVTKCVRNWLNW